jgi:hypothetical protein
MCRCLFSGAPGVRHWPFSGVLCMLRLAATRIRHCPGRNVAAFRHAGPPTASGISNPAPDLANLPALGMEEAMEIIKAANPCFVS